MKSFCRFHLFAVPRLILLILPWATFSASANVADASKGAELSGQCIACHGVGGVSTADAYPNLAAQKAPYIQNQLIAFRSGDRKNPLMNAIAASLSDEDIDNLALHFSQLPGAEAGSMASNDSGLTSMLPSFPADYQSEFSPYQIIEFEDNKQVRRYWGNQLAMDAASSGEAFPEGAVLFVEIMGAKVDADGNLVKSASGALIPGEVTGFTAMEKQSGWGDKVPAVLKNDDWRYAVFSVDGEHKEGVNEAACLACHKPLNDTDYVFTYESMSTFEK